MSRLAAPTAKPQPALAATFAPNASTIPKLLETLKYCRHFNRKTKEGANHPDRDAQFEYINAKVEAFQASDQPVISVDTKKKELVGEFKNGGSDYGPQGQPIEVNSHDFENKELGKVVPTASTTSAPTWDMSAS
jgi:Rhodopirellula transposase DDE domain